MSDHRVVRISNDTGFAKGTRIVDEKTGLEFSAVASLDIEIRVADRNKAIIELGLIALDVAADAHFTLIDPRTGRQREVSRIIFADGEELSLIA